MKGKHYAILGGFLIALSVQLAGVQHWHEVLNPSFVAGALGQIGAVLAAMFTEKPSNGAS